MQAETASSHYAELGSGFDQAWFFASGYREWLANRICLQLQLGAEDVLVDIGGGTGLFSELVRQQAGLKSDVVCVDRCPELLEVAAKRPGIKVCCADVQQYFMSPLPGQKILLKEIVHHLPKRPQLWQSMHYALPAEGSVLIVTRPRQSEFPLFAAALDEFARTQPDSETLIAELRQAGFAVQCTEEKFEIKMTTEQWLKMVGSRFLSTLTMIDEEAFVQGYEALKNELSGRQTVEFADRIIFIQAVKR
ncbi:class I SAM-dependent methyltransferase [Endozoicomonadaceae bacterium StTr2]